jgi:hypothetical protein
MQANGFAAAALRPAIPAYYVDGARVLQKDANARGRDSPVARFLQAQ